MPARPATHQALVTDAGSCFLVEVLDTGILLRLRTRRRLLLDRARQLHSQPLERGSLLVRRRLERVSKVNRVLVLHTRDPSVETLARELRLLQQVRGRRGC